MNTACKHCSSWGTRWIQLVRRAAIVSTLCSTTDAVSMGWCCEAPSFQPGWPSLAARVNRQFLLAHVQQCYGKLRRLETDLFFQKHQLEFVIGQQWLAIIEEHKGQAQEKVARTAKERQKKFDMLVLTKETRQMACSQPLFESANHTSATGPVQGSELCSNPQVQIVWRLQSQSPMSLKGRPRKPGLVSSMLLAMPSYLPQTFIHRKLRR